MSDFREKCIGKARLIGTFAAIPHPVAVEVTAQAGLDFICIDWEHAQIARDTIENMVRAADVHRVPAMVRVPGPRAGGDRRRAGQRRARRAGPARLDRRAGRAAVKASRYPPLGERGVGPGGPPAMATASPNISLRANAEIVVAVQVETAEGLANVDQIAATDGVDVVFVGPGDLSVSIDAMGPAGARQARPGDRDDHRRRAGARQDRRHLLRKAGGCRPIGPPRAPASSSWPATRCSSAPASRQATLLPAASSRKRTGLIASGASGSPQARIF